MQSCGILLGSDEQFVERTQLERRIVGGEAAQVRLVAGAVDDEHAVTGLYDTK